MMIRFLLTSSFLVILSAGVCFADSPATTPAPAIGVRFNLPLANQSTAQAIILPTADGKAQLVYASPTGQLALWTLTPMTPPGPSPTPDPSPVDPPTPPSGLSLIQITATAPATIPPEVAARLAVIDSAYYAYTHAMVADPSPPANSLQWIGRSAGKPIPYSFLADRTGVILWQGPSPKTAADWLQILPAPAAPIGAAPICPFGTCPLNLRKPK